MEGQSHSVRQAKEQLRRVYRSQRDQLDVSKRQQAAEMAARRFFMSMSELAPPEVATRLMLYVAFRGEMDPAPLGRRAAKYGWEIYLPRIRKRGFIEPVKVGADPILEPGRYGILQPADHLPSADPTLLDIIIVPGIAFDTHGHRVGYGAGYYDRFLPQAPGARWIGLTYDCLLVPELPAEIHDQRLHAILTEKRFHSLRQNAPPQPGEVRESER